jgi:hypothetical protein
MTARATTVFLCGLIGALMTDGCSHGDPPKPVNHLASEKSPYLLQHMYNPVDWYPWGDEAFEIARRENRPIFLSIGYATCHWCHVMEHESFEDPTVADLMNQTFVNIKVDREERPDVDQVYMTVCQMLTGSGGWPLTILMTPDRRPFYAATYVPRTSRHGRPGMLDLIPRVHQMWSEERDALLTSASEILTHLESSSTRAAGSDIESSAVTMAIHQLESRYDATSGGFGSAPKFPSPHTLVLLLRYAAATGDVSAREMALRTLDAMRAGGIYDHIGFGFHRYSTDSAWLLPHFEKMLYDQAMHLMALTTAYETTHHARFAVTAREIMTYVLRDMSDSAGGFYSAEDADSEGEEGRFYVWTTAELRDTLGDSDAKLAIRLWGAADEGNFTDEASGHRSSANVLHRPSSIDDLAASMDLSADDLRQRVDDLRRRLFERRETRVHPLKDDKVLADWNGLMATAAARAGRVFGEPAWVDAAVSSTAFVDEQMRDPHDRLLHRFRDGEAAIPGFLDDSAFQLWASLELYDATFEPRWLARASGLANDAIERFHDPDRGGFFFSAGDAENLLIRPREAYDGAIPSGNSVMATCLVRLSRLTGRSELENLADTTVSAFGPDISRAPSAHAQMLQAVLDLAAPSLEVVIAGDRDAPDTTALIDVVRASGLASAALVVVEPGGRRDAIRELAPFTAYHTPIDGRAAAYVCRDFSCRLPTTDPADLRRLLAEGHD